MFNFDEHPGLLFVLATLLPLASFAVLLLWGALRWALRPYAKQPGPIAEFFEAIGGNVPGRNPAYVALAAIFAAFLLCAVGFAMYLPDNMEKQRAAASIESLQNERTSASKETRKTDAFKKRVKQIDTQVAEEETTIARIETRWKGTIDWAAVRPVSVSSPATIDDQNGSTLKIGYRIDMLNASMFVMVTFIATLIHLFSIGYMADELQKVVEDHEVHGEHGHYQRRGRFGRFFMYLSFFCFSMLNLLLADNLFQIFVSWELVGVCSYLLISFYFERTSASNAANKAFITNRVGDAGFIIGLLILWTQVGTLNFEELFQRIRAPHYDPAHKGELFDWHDGFLTADLSKSESKSVELETKPYKSSGDYVVIFPKSLPKDLHLHTGGDLTAYASPKSDQFGFMPYWMLVVAGLGIFLGCVGKSAQFPLHVWLPDAMEGPTPVSALIHAATMVAAGVYLVGRSFPLFAPEVLLTIAYVGAITLFSAATIAIVMTDIKKVLAYSTVSQLGYMMLALGVGGWAAGLFHLITHAFFKALLFLGSGSVIYGCHHQQDMFKMGGLFPKMRITAITMLIGVLTIAGIPMFSGWYSKDAVLASALGFVSEHRQHALLFILPLMTAGITTFYMFRMWLMTFTGKPRDLHVYDHAHESPWVMTLPLVLLAIMSVTVAWGWPLWNAEASWLGHQLESAEHAAVDADLGENVHNFIHHGGHELAGNLALGVVLIGIAFAFALYYFKALDPKDAFEKFPGLHRFLMHKWYFDEFYSAALVRPSLTVAHWCRGFDTLVIDGLINSFARLNLRVSRWSGQFDRGIVDGLVNLVSDVCYAIGSWFRTWQTGSIRNYVLFLALAAVGLWVVLSFLVTGSVPAATP